MSTSENQRLDADRAPGHGIDQDTRLTFTVDGIAYTGHPGDTLASALVAAGRLDCGPSMYLGRPRGILTAGVEEPNALVTVQSRGVGDVAESMLPATVVELTDGLEATFLSGLGTLDPTPDESIYDHKHIHTDVLVVGAGPAGLAAAREAAASGARTILMDDQALPGGSLLSGRDQSIDGMPACDWARSTVEEMTRSEDVTYLPRTTAFGSYDGNFVVAVERRTDHLERRSRPGVSRQRIWHVRAGQVILATGAHERPLVFANNDRPGIMLAGAVRTYLNRHAALAGRQVVVATTNDSAYRLVDDLHAAGVTPVAVVDSRTDRSPFAAAVLERTGARSILGSAVVDTRGDGPAGRISAVTVAPVDDDGGQAGEGEQFEVDLLAVSGGHSPVVHLHSQRQGPLTWDSDAAAFVPAAPVRDQHLAGSVTGPVSLDQALRQGAEAGQSAASAAGTASPLTAPSVAPMEEAPAAERPVWLAPSSSGPRPTGTPTSWTCSGTRRSPTSSAPPARACARWSTSSGTPRSPRRTTRARPPR